MCETSLSKNWHHFPEKIVSRPNDSLKNLPNWNFFSINLATNPQKNRFYREPLPKHLFFDKLKQKIWISNNNRVQLQSTAILSFLKEDFVVVNLYYTTNKRQLSEKLLILKYALDYYCKVHLIPDSIISVIIINFSFWPYVFGD